MNTKIKKKLTALLLMFFSIFGASYCYAVAVGESYGGGTVFCVSQTPDITQCVPVGSGDYGLIIANEDQANADSNANNGVQWSTAYTAVPGARSDDDGASNTAAIIAAFPGDNPSNNAAWLCHNYNEIYGNAETEEQQERAVRFLDECNVLPTDVNRIIAAYAAGHDDWYLPSKNELNKMFVYAHANNLIGKGCSGSKLGGVQCLVGGYEPPIKIYWSSTEYSDDHNGAWNQNFGGWHDRGIQYYEDKFPRCMGVRAVRAFSNLPSEQLYDLLLDGRSISEALVIMDINSNIECLRFAFSRHDIDAAGLAAIAQNHSADADLLRDIAGHPRSDAITLLAIARNSITETLGLSAVVHNPNIDAHTLAAVATHHNADATLLTEIAANPDADTETLLAIVQNDNAEIHVLERVLHHPNINARVLAAVAIHRNIVANTLLNIARNPITNLTSLNIIVRNPNVNTQILTVIKYHPNINETLLVEVLAGLQGLSRGIKRYMR